MSYILRIHKIKKFTKTKLQQKPFSHSFRPSVLQSACVSDLFFSLFSKKSVWRTLRTRALSLCKDDKLKNLRQMGTCFCIMDDLRIRLVLSVLLFEPKFTNNVNLNKGLHSSFLFLLYTVRGTGGKIIIGEELAFMSKSFFDNVMAPVLVADASFIGITTWSKNINNFVNRLIELKHENGESGNFKQFFDNSEKEKKFST